MPPFPVQTRMAMFMSISIQAIVTQTTITPTVAQRLMTSTRWSSCSSLRWEWKRGAIVRR